MENGGLLHNKRVAIIGGGPGGLTLAVLLQQQGVSVTVYERDAGQRIRPQGSSLDLHHDTGLKAITAAGLLDTFKDYYRPGADKTVIADSQMQVLFDEGHQAAQKGFGDAQFRPEIDRGPLRDLLIAALGAEHVVWDAKFAGLQPCGSGWEIIWEQGETVYADLVIGADGARSKVRSYLTDKQQVYSGITALDGSISDAAKNAPGLWNLVNGGSLVAMEEGRVIFFITKGDGSLNFMIAHKAPEDWSITAGVDWTDRLAVASWFEKEFAGWSSAWQELFRTDAMNLVLRPWYYFPVEQAWETKSNLTLIGDAAHLMPPNGEGANQAMVDALELCTALCSGSFDTLDTAIADFEQKMRERCRIVKEDTEKLMATMHAPDNLVQFMSLWQEWVLPPASEI